MGIHLSLYANFEKIKPKAWETAYQETLFFLKNFPVPLMRLDRIPLGENLLRFSWTTQLSRETEQKQEFWEVWGDFHTCQTGENFCLYRDMLGKLEGKYNKEKEKVERAFSPNSIFYVSENYDYHNPEFGIDVFGAWATKTQGEPYHLAILAVCICLENHFEGSAYVAGDFDMNQAQEVVAWMQSHTDKIINLPICCDQARLWKQISKAYKSPYYAIQRHLEICKLDREEKYKFLAEAAGRQALFEVLADQIMNYNSITQYGAIDIWLAVLSVWEDVDVLLDFISFANTKKGENPFVWSELLKSLCGEYVTINPLLKERANFLYPETNDLPSVEGMLSQAIFAMGGSRRKNLQLYISKEEIWEAFMAKNPKEAELYKKILDATEISNAKALKEMNEKLDKIENEIILQEEKETQRNEKNEAYQESMERKLLGYPATDRYIMRQVFLAEPRFSNFAKSIANIGKQAQTFLKQHENCQFDNLANSLENIKLYANHANLILKETTWAKIDQIQDLELLNLLGVLISWKMDGKNDADWRKYCLEGSEYWEIFKKGTC